jgi:hypothetical protein
VARVPCTYLETHSSIRVHSALFYLVLHPKASTRRSLNRQLFQRRELPSIWSAALGYGQTWETGFVDRQAVRAASGLEYLQPASRDYV